MQCRCRTTNGNLQLAMLTVTALEIRYSR